MNSSRSNLHTITKDKSHKELIFQITKGKKGGDFRFPTITCMEFITFLSVKLQA